MTLCQSPGQGKSLGSQQGSGWGGGSSGIWILLHSLQPFTTKGTEGLRENQAPHVGNGRGLSPRLTGGNWVWAMASLHNLNKQQPPTGAQDHQFQCQGLPELALSMRQALIP